GFVIGTFSFLRVSVAIASSSGRGSGEDPPPPFDQAPHAVCEARLRSETEQLPRSARITDATRRERTRRLRLELDADAAAGDLEQERGEVAHPRLHAAADVHDSVRGLGLAREHVRARDVADIYEVHRRAAVPE